MMMQQADIFGYQKGNTKFDNAIAQKTDRLDQFDTNLTRLQTQKQSTGGVLSSLVDNFEGLDPAEQRSAVLQAYRKEKVISNLGKMKSKDQHVYNAVQGAIDNLTDDTLRKQLTNVFKGFAYSVEDHYGEKSKDLTLKSLISGYSGQIRAKKQKDRLDERRARLAASQFFYIN